MQQPRPSKSLLVLSLAAMLLTLMVSVPTSFAKSGKKGSGNKSGYGSRAGSASRSGSGNKPGSSTKSGYTSLFNGKDLDGWVRLGGTAEYTVEDGSIVGTAKHGTPNTFLATEREFTNFIFEVDFRIDDGLNSGIQIRSESRPVATVGSSSKAGSEKKAAGSDKKKEGSDKKAGSDAKAGSNTKEGSATKAPSEIVFGYQVEIDTTERSWSAGIYDEARRGWLYNLEGPKNKKAREAFKHNDWNHYRIVARGDVIRTWINGVKAANLNDDMTPKGFIALQVHSIKPEDKDLAGKTVEWRNLQIKELK